ncbi:MAG: Ribosomal protein S12 methylthiotransferase RimO [Methanosaeta sp. PtaB.Bin039]|nr:MAG: Ribosomal protein S12 methylthiotransferase RimO [Methanosaeta sp. PtaB.Bin039]HOT07527.1 radical SAM protein [Methanotrichaceae archaeon]HQF16125.1 radical SAM protein [Methanotrichaceae archaeon]HQI90761.1 radical SAM protein [Methanotrichaceae archaeon]HQJ28283.1 radical SAM protein [Methanotrichaceae archaeon]
MSGKRIVLTSDRTMMSSYHGGVLLGFAATMPRSVMPDRIFHWLFCPPVPADPDGSARFAPCGMRKVEASLLEAGFSEEEVMVAHPDHLDRAIGPDTEVVGITHDDPLGKIALREIEEIINRGIPHNRYRFLELINHPRIRRYRPRIVVGGNGAWELKGEEVGVDHIFLGEGENEFPRICRAISSGEELPRVIQGSAVSGGDIPVNRGASIAGLVEIGRGCWRGCAFCSPTMRSLRHRPLERILQDARLNLDAGSRDVLLHSEDVFTYGSQGLRPAPDKVLKLFEEVKRLKPATIDVSHLSLATVHQNMDLLRQVSRVVGIGSDQQYMSAWIGIETGSCRILEMHMPRKALPKTTANWPEMVRDCYALFDEQRWLPVASLVLGLPGEEEEDVASTIDLVESLKGYTGLILPLFFSPMSETRLGAVRGFGRQQALPEHWELVGLCMEYNLRHLKTLHRLYRERMTASPAVHLALKVVNLAADRVLHRYLNRMKQGQPPN